MIGSGARTVQGRDSTVTMAQRPNAAIPSEIDSDRKLSMIAPCGGSQSVLDSVEFRNCENFKIVPAPFVICAGTDWNRGVAVSRAVVALIVAGPCRAGLARWHSSRCHYADALPESDIVSLIREM